MAGTTLHLRGITADHPAHALATAGLCTILETVARGVTVAWTQREPGSLDQHLTILGLPTRLNTIDRLAVRIDTDMKSLVESPLIAAAPPSLRLSPEEALPWISEVVATGDERLIRQLAGLLDTDPLAAVKGRMRRTRLDFTSGNALHMKIVRELVGMITFEDVAATLTGDGVRELPSTPYLRWSGIPKPPSALLVDLATDTVRGRPVGIEWLAWLGLAALPVRYVHLTDQLHWHTPTTALSPTDALHLTTAGAVHYGPWAGGAWSCPIRPSDPDHRERYWEFGPPSGRQNPEGAYSTRIPHSFSGAEIRLMVTESVYGPLRPVGVTEIAWLCDVDRKTVQQWVYGGVLQPAAWLIDGTSGAWPAGEAIVAVIESGHRILALSLPPQEATRRVFEWALREIGDRGEPWLLDNQLIDPDWTTDTVPGLDNPAELADSETDH